jgi:DNA-binding response OmpR family regulator
VLGQAGYRVLESGSGEEALGLASAFDGTFDLLLTDVVMSGINGRVLCERLRAWFPSLRCLFMSGYTDDTILRAGVVADAGVFMSKPFTPDALLKRVEAALAQGAAARADRE